MVRSDFEPLMPYPGPDVPPEYPWVGDSIRREKYWNGRVQFTVELEVSIVRLMFPEVPPAVIHTAPDLFKVLPAYTIEDVDLPTRIKQITTNFSSLGATICTLELEYYTGLEKTQ
jgi:hypothetical protein